MKKVLVVFLVLVFSMSFMACEPESIADTDNNIYAGDKDEEPDH